MDSDFVVQGFWSDGRIAEEDGDDDVEKAIKKAEKMASSSTFEGTAVRVLTRDGEIEWMWESPKHARRPTFERRSHGYTMVGNLSACFKGDDGEDLIVYGDVVLPPVLKHNCEYDAIPSHCQVDDPAWSFPNLGRDLSDSEEKAALEALFQKACDALMARN